MSVILEELSRGHRDYVGPRSWPQWRVEFAGEGKVLKAHLYAADFAITALDHHRFAIGKPNRPEYVPPGYHWDIWPPLGPEKREWLAPQPKDPFQVLQALATAWNITYETDLLLLGQR